MRNRRALWLLLLPVATIVVPPLYARNVPELGGIPFFVWYQFLAVIVGGAITGVVYVLVRRPEDR